MLCTLSFTDNQEVIAQVYDDLDNTQADSEICEMWLVSKYRKNTVHVSGRTATTL